MATAHFSSPKRRRGGLGPALRRASPWALLCLAATSASCVPIGVESASIAPAAVTGAAPAMSGSAPVAPFVAELAMLPAAVAPSAPLQGASGYAFVGRSPIDRMRAMDCLSQAIYYEARSESEAGQRAVAQVVLNRVRNPGWPNSVCGVVYQGPMRVGGGCQFTFTCDGSLMSAPGGIGWAQARRIAGEALAGRVFTPVGLSTHYHAQYVSPSWAPRLIPTAVIGLHDFYQMPGSAGQARAFTAAYSGFEPIPRPAMFMPRRTNPGIGLAGLFPTGPAAALRGAPTVPSDIPADPRWAASNLPQSTVRDEFRASGQWRSDAPIAVTGAR
jgi:hypothetical protein